MARAELFSGNGKAVTVGIVVVVVFPALMVLYGTYFIWQHIIKQRQRRAAWVLSKDPESVGRVSCPPPTAHRTQLCTSQQHLPAGCHISAAFAGMLSHRGPSGGGPAVAGWSETSHAPMIATRHS